MDQIFPATAKRLEVMVIICIPGAHLAEAT